jgi:hypothetical protein
LIDKPDDFCVTAPVWKWRAADPSVTAQTAAEIRYAALGRLGGFGSVRVSVRLGTTRWQTSLFPHKESGGFILPLKAAVRKAEGIGVGDSVTVALQV